MMDSKKTLFTTVALPSNKLDFYVFLEDPSSSRCKSLIYFNIFSVFSCVFKLYDEIYSLFAETILALA